MKKGSKAKRPYRKHVEIRLPKEILARYQRAAEGSGLTVEELMVAAIAITLEAARK